MKPTMLSKKNASYLFDHVLDGFKSSFEGIEKLKADNLIGEKEFIELLEKNSARLIERIREFKMLNGMVCIFFAIMFLFMQVMGEEIDMRRSSRPSTSTRTARARANRRRDETEPMAI